MLVAALLAVTCGLAACGEDAAKTASKPAPPPREAFPSTTPQQGGVALPSGLTTRAPSDNCASCHADVVRNYATSGMNLSLTLPHGPGSVEARFVGKEVVDPLTGIRYRLDLKDGKYVQRLRYVDPTGVERAHFESEVDLVVGSGHKTRSYFQVKDGRFFELGVTWYAEQDRMALSPGIGFRSTSLRFATQLCVGCHTGFVEARAPGLERGFEGHVSMGISCDRCHGPGDAHAMSGDPTEIVSPKKLPLDRQGELCFQCHLSGAFSILREGAELPAYRVGEPLGNVVGVFDGPLPDDDADAGISAHADRMKRSLCFQKRPDMTCTTCHNPHLGHRGEAAAKESKTGCFVCHVEDDCGEAHGSRQGRSCASCHMAVRPSSDIEHTTITDHFIQRTLPDRSQMKAARPGQFDLPRIARLALEDVPLTNLLDPEDELPGALALKARAYLRAAWEGRGPGGLPEGPSRRAIATAKKAVAATPEDPGAREALGIALLRGGQAGDGLRALDALLVDHPDREEARLALAFAWSNAGRPQKAIEYLEPALEADPYSEPVAIPLLLALEAANRGKDALDLLDELRPKLGPSRTRAQIGLRVASATGDHERAIAHGWDLLMFAPREAPALAAVAEALLAAKRPLAVPRALIQDALVRDPRSLPALLAATEMHLAAGEKQKARQALENAASLDRHHPRVMELGRRLR